MDSKNKLCCPNCSQLYYLKLVADPKKRNIPLYLSCGHTMCESCITNIVKFGEPIECKVCHRDMQLSPEEMAQLNEMKIKLYKLFPVNFTMLGELTMQLFEQHPEKQEQKEDNFFIDLHAILNSVNVTKGQCMECQNQTSKMCLQCATILCDTCFNKSHKNFVIFKNHVLTNIEQVVTPNNCKLHKTKPLDYYCQDCKKSICMDCLMVGGEKSCKNHNVVPMQEVNDNFLEDLIDIVPKVDEVFRRLTKTAVDVGYLLYNSENETGSSNLTQILNNVKQNFCKIMAAIQKHEQEVADIIIKLKYAEKDSLLKAQIDIANSIKKAKTVLNSINAASSQKKVKQINLPVLLDEAKKIVETPWYLHKDESGDALKVVVNEDLCTLISDYIHLEGNAESVYRLRSTAELGKELEIPPPPSAPVFPPDVPKDVRQTTKSRSEKSQSPKFCRRVPGYRCKSGSVSSLNSLHSDSSDKGGQTYHGDVYQNYQRPIVQQVQPFAESQHPKQLHEGSQELIYISHIVDPHNFFVQRACHQNLVKEMLREFRNAVSLPRPSLNHVAEGKLYLTFSKADNMWQRCRIVSIIRKDPANPTFVVFCIDFGSTETVTIDKLRLLPPARVQTPYPLAINCCLANCVPATGSWTFDDAYLIQNIVNNKQAIIHVRHIRSTSNYSVTLDCDVTTFEDGVSLAHALVFHERARMPNPRLQYPQITPFKEKPKIFMSNDLKPKSVEEVFITHIDSPDKFYVRKSHLMSVYDKLSEDMEQEYGVTNNSERVYLPEIGVAYAVNLSKSCEAVEGPAWARGVALQLPGRARVRLLLPDSGRATLVHSSTLRPLQRQFTTQRALASECQLAGVTPLNEKWSGKSVLLLQQYAGRALRLHVEEARGPAAGVTLFYSPDVDNTVCINALMIQHKFAVTFGMYTFNKNYDQEDQVFTNKSPLEQPKSRAKKPQKQVMQRKQVTNVINEKELDAKDKGPLRLEAKVLHYHSPSLLYVSLVHQQKVFSELFDQIQKHYSKKTTQDKNDWKIGDRCCTTCNESQTWRRAVILELDGDKAKVFYSDFACVETIPKSNLKELAPEFMSVGDAAIKCHLCGIVPGDGTEEWPTITKEYLKELLDAYHRVFITKLGNFKNNSMPVEMWVFHMTQGGALEPNKSEWRCLNKKIIEQGLGIPDKTHKVTSDEEGSKDDMLSFLKNVTGSVDDWLQLEPMPTKPLNTDRELESPVKSNDEDDEESHSKATNSSNTVFISDWLPPEPLPSKEFTGVPTYVDNNGVIYLYDVTQQDTMDLIRKALDVRFKSPDPKAKYAKWTVGEPCVALFYLDNRFYRGRVLHVDTEAATCIIHYVDYGNEETCSFENLRKSIALYQIPVQAHKCVLDRIRPVDAHWNRQTLDYIHKSIVEKKCFVKVTGEPVGDLLPIELKYDKLWINDHLVDFEMAVYSDGSKAVVRKFAGNSKRREARPVVEIEQDIEEPDFIVEEENCSSTSTSFKSTDILKNWNDTMLEEEQRNDAYGKFITYPNNGLTEFICNIAIIHDVNTLELSIIHNDETNVLYEEMFEDIQQNAHNQPPLDGIFENKACVALFHEDGLWYRASILQYSESTGRIKVRYVDYGNIEVITIADIREIAKEWTDLPPKTVKVRLHNIEINQDVKMSVIAQEYADTFLDKGPFNANVIKSLDTIPCVELRNDAGEIVYEKLIQNGVIKICDS